MKPYNKNKYTEPFATKASRKKVRVPVLGLCGVTCSEEHQGLYIHPRPSGAITAIDHPFFSLILIRCNIHQNIITISKHASTIRFPSDRGGSQHRRHGARPTCSQHSGDTVLGAGPPRHDDAGGHSRFCSER